MIQFPSLQLWGPQGRSVLPFLLLGAAQKAEHSGLPLALRALIKDPHVFSPLFTLLCLSDDEDGSWLLLSSDKGDHSEPPAPESRIQSFFGQWYRGEAEAPGTETSRVAPSQLQGGEETLQPPHQEPVGRPTAPDS